MTQYQICTIWKVVLLLLLKCYSSVKIMLLIAFPVYYQSIFVVALPKYKCNSSFIIILYPTTLKNDFEILCKRIVTLVYIVFPLKNSFESHVSSKIPKNNFNVFIPLIFLLFSVFPIFKKKICLKLFYSLLKIEKKFFCPTKQKTNKKTCLALFEHTKNSRQRKNEKIGKNEQFFGRWKG